MTRWIFYCNVGNLPKEKASAYIKEMLPTIRDGLKIPDEEPLIGLPVREGQETRLEVIFT